MAREPGRNLWQLGPRAARVLLRRGNRNVFSAYWILFRIVIGRGISDKLFGFAEKLVPPGHHDERQRDEGGRHCWVRKRTGGGRDDLQTSAHRSFSITKRRCPVLSRLLVAHATN